MSRTVNRRTLLLLPAFLFAMFALSACGNKGPLYIPPPPIEQPSNDTNTANADS